MYYNTKTCDLKEKKLIEATFATMKALGVNGRLYVTDVNGVKKDIEIKGDFSEIRKRRLDEKEKFRKIE
jgi:hypothetical protein